MIPDNTQHSGVDGAGDVNLTWDAGGRPFSRRFDDVYFSRASGLDESRYVFIEQNQLPQRWANWHADGCFVIGETGFGTGLNFLVAWDIWRRLAPPQARLHFISVEKYPLNRNQLQQALQLWPQLQNLAAELIESYPPLPAEGFHRLILDNTRVTLTLIFDDAVAGLQQLQPVSAPGPTVARSGASWAGKITSVDAWFLDGFAPSKNPDMWSQPLFQTLARLSGTGTTFATFSSAARIKQGLPAVGFAVRKVRGFGRKRDMLCGNFHASGAEPIPSSETSATKDQTWHLMADGSSSGPTERHIVVIGGGLAGCQSARALAERGYRVTLLEKARIASGASGNAQGVVYAKAAANPGALADFNHSALQFACRYYKTRIGYATCGELSGVIHVPQTEKQTQDYCALAARFEGEANFVRWLKPQQTEAECGLFLPTGGLLFPQAGWLDPRRLCRQLVDHEQITCLETAPIEQLVQDQGQWQALGAKGAVLARAPQMVIASASDALKLPQTCHLPIKPIRGQVTEVAATPASRRLSRVLCGNGYIAPAYEGKHCLGASFNLHDSSTRPEAADDRTNLANVGDLSGTLTNWGEPMASRVSFRCASPDYLPLVGAAPVAVDFNRDFARLRRNARTPIDATGHYYPGLFINIGHGSRGLAYTPLCAELLASLIDGEPLPLARESILRLHPARFLIRNLQRNK
jgi:tRNA 5-methylaminomethyl-2-thiouridine biosynthesis bifunctional protein